MKQYCMGGADMPYLHGVMALTSEPYNYTAAINLTLTLTVLSFFREINYISRVLDTSLYIDY